MGSVAHISFFLVAKWAKVEVKQCSRFSTFRLKTKSQSWTIRLTRQIWYLVTFKFYGQTSYIQYIVFRILCRSNKKNQAVSFLRNSYLFFSLIKSKEFSTLIIHFNALIKPFEEKVAPPLQIQ